MPGDITRALHQLSERSNFQGMKSCLHGLLFRDIVNIAIVPNISVSISILNNAGSSGQPYDLAALL